MGRVESVVRRDHALRLHLRLRVEIESSYVVVHLLRLHWRAAGRGVVGSCLLEDTSVLGPGLLCVGLCAALIFCTAANSRGDVKLPTILDSHMVLQRDVPLNFWGWADAGEKVTVTMGDEAATTVAAKDGTWKVSLSAQKADSKARTITISGNNTIELKDVLIGEVWIGSGQSNMEWTNDQFHYQETDTTFLKTNIRLFKV